MVACIDVKNQHIYISVMDDVLHSIPCYVVPKVIVSSHTQLLLFIFDFRSAAYFSADTCVLLLILVKQITPSVNPDS